MHMAPGTRLALLLGGLLSAPGHAHDPLFGLGSHVLFKGGTQTALHLEGRGPAHRTTLELTHSPARDWALSLALPGDERPRLGVRHRLWRQDAPGRQRALAVTLQGDGRNAGAGMAYGFESLRWYRWAGLRWGRGAGKTRWRADLALGWRPTLPHSTRPDTVWLLELNGEDGPARRLFLAPGVFWTWRNFAVKGGAQLPLPRPATGKTAQRRLLATLEWHF